ncbi:MAG: PRC-barrel domain-containing protein [Candidatus Asgardarchaeia archaeon]
MSNNDEELINIKDLEGKMIVDAEGEIVGILKDIFVDQKGEIKIQFQVDLGDKVIVPSQMIPFSVVESIGDVILLKAKVKIKRKL